MLTFPMAPQNVGWIHGFQVSRKSNLRRSFENGPFPLLAESSSGQSFGAPGKRQRFGLKKGIEKKLEVFLNFL